MLIDLSSNNPHPINYAAAKAAGVTGVFIKATDGARYTNPFYAPDAAGFAAVGVPVLAYHFAEFGDPLAEAKRFLSVAGARARVLDVETSDDVAWMNAFLSTLNLPVDEEMTYGSASSLPRSGIRSLLWPASYGKNYGFGDCWQFTDAQSVPGIGGQVDASVWVGPAADFNALFSITDPPPKPPEVDAMTGISPIYQFKPGGTQHRGLVLLGQVGHSYRTPGAGWVTENVGKMIGGAVADLVFDEDQVPQVQIINDVLVIGARTSDGGAWEFDQADQAKTWGNSSIL